MQYFYALLVFRTSIFVCSIMYSYPALFFSWRYIRALLQDSSRSLPRYMLRKPRLLQKKEAPDAASLDINSSFSRASWPFGSNEVCPLNNDNAVCDAVNILLGDEIKLITGDSPTFPRKLMPHNTGDSRCIITLLSNKHLHRLSASRSETTNISAFRGKNKIIRTGLRWSS